MLTTNKSKFYPKTVDHNNAMIAELKENPSYDEIYLQAAFEEIYQPSGIPAFLTALRRVIEARGGLGEFSKKQVYHVSIFTLRYPRTETQLYSVLLR